MLPGIQKGWCCIATRVKFPAVSKYFSGSVAAQPACEQRHYLRGILHLGVIMAQLHGPEHHGLVPRRSALGETCSCRCCVCCVCWWWLIPMIKMEKKWGRDGAIRCLMAAMAIREVCRIAGHFYCAALRVCCPNLSTQTGAGNWAHIQMPDGIWWFCAGEGFQVATI